jgi:hypothetical protein
MREKQLEKRGGMRFGGQVLSWGAGAELGCYLPFHLPALGLPWSRLLRVFLQLEQLIGVLVCVLIG